MSTVLVRLPAEPVEGDPFGIHRAGDPHTVVTEATVPLELVAANDDGTATVRSYGQEMDLQEGTGLMEYQRRSGIQHAILRQLRDAIAPLRQDGAASVRTAADVVAAIVTGNGRSDVAQTLAQVATNANQSDANRTQALTLLAVLLAAEGD